MDVTEQRPGSGGDGVFEVTFGGVTRSLATLFGSAYVSVANLQDGKHYVAGGGGGGGDTVHSCEPPGTGVITRGGLGGGGVGLKCSDTRSAGAGMANTGGGGGGGGAYSSGTYNMDGGAGGSGMILIRYSTCQPCGAGTRLVSAGASGSCEPA